MRDDLPSMRQVQRLQRAHEETLKVLILAEVFVGLQADPDGTASWLHEVFEKGEIPDHPQSTP